ncbi:DUF1707 SHOCT-like domain-containing protein [Actinomadura atramentaria]|uniref:DUF1707 SHOCT-like domain-containing protein n=1 Tax=Actinomadura atramentaria TaxID=1990 RepID=UPI0003A56002|nr:DUF1707 domain-containing protein [Actinomadura atramentaria]
MIGTGTSTADGLRVGDAERDAVATALHDHFVQGRIDQAELDERLDAALAAKTVADLRRVVADLPGPNGLPEDGPEPSAFPFGGPWGPALEHGALQHHRMTQHHMRRQLHQQMREAHRAHRHPHGHHHGPYHGHHHGHHHGPHAAFPLLLVVFLSLLWTAGIGTAFAGVFTAAFLVWTVRAVFHVARHRRGAPS